MRQLVTTKAYYVNYLGGGRRYALIDANNKILLFADDEEDLEISMMHCGFTADLNAVRLVVFYLDRPDGIRRICFMGDDNRSVFSSIDELDIEKYFMDWGLAPLEPREEDPCT